MTGETFLAWAAGFFDGEGCVLVSEVNKTKRTHSHSLVCSVTQNNQEPLNLFRDKFGGNVVVGGGRYCWQWKCTGPVAYKFLEAIRPYTVMKSDQVDVALSWPLPHMKFNGTGIPPAVRAGREKVMLELRAIRAASKMEAERSMEPTLARRAAKKEASKGQENA